jgi:acetyltransferase
LTADMLGSAGLRLPPLSDTVRDELNSIVNGFGWAANPADLTGYLLRDDFPRIVRCMIDQPDVGTLVVASAGSEERAAETIGLRDETSKGVVYLWTAARGDHPGLSRLKAAAIPIFYSPATLARGLKSLHTYHAWRDQRLQSGFASTPELTHEQQHSLETNTQHNTNALSEFESKRLLAAWGVPDARDARASSAAEAVAAAEAIGYPVALKADSPDLLHKTEAGAVRLNLSSAIEVASAYSDIAARAHTGDVLVQEMIANGIEVIVGVSYDPQFGPILLFGSGGVFVEVYRDVALRQCPIGESEALEMISEVRGARLLGGFRGRPPADIPALARALVSISHLGLQLEGQIAELDVNPLMVLPAGEGVKAADALVVLSGARPWSRSG